jgi:hypothetical protein
MCYFEKETENERVSEVCLGMFSGIPELLEYLGSEFQIVNLVNNYILSYIDEDEEQIEVSSSISIWDVANEAKLLVLNKK